MSETLRPEPFTECLLRQSIVLDLLTQDDTQSATSMAHSVVSLWVLFITESLKPKTLDTSSNYLNYLGTPY